MNLVRTAIPLALFVALIACKNDQTDTTPTTAAQRDQNASWTDNTSTTTTTTGSTGSTSTGGSTTGGSTTGGSTMSPSTGTGSDSMGGGGSMQASNMRYEMATARITGALCDREITCQQVGPDKRFTTRDSCVGEHGKRVENQVKASDCSKGVDSGKLQSCLAAITQQDCASMVSSIQSVDACKATALCVGAGPMM